MSHASQTSFAEDMHARLAAMEDASYWFKHRNDVITQVVKLYPPRSGVFLDVGGGNGVVAKHLVGEGLRVVVLEPGGGGAAAARARGLEAHQCDLESYAPPPETSVTACGFFDVVEHVDDDLALLRGAFAKMQPGGRLYITVPAHAWLWSDEDVAAGHFRRHTRGSICRLAEAAGFRVDFASYFFGFLVAPIFLIRALPSRLGVRQRSQAEGEHAAPAGPVGAMMRATFAHEMRTIAARRALAWGGSIVLAAHKPG